MTCFVSQETAGLSRRSLGAGGRVTGKSELSDHFALDNEFRPA